MGPDDQLKDNGLTGLMHSLPAKKPSGELNARIMERIRQEKNYVERRSDRRILCWAIALSVLVLGIGVWALDSYIDWRMFLPQIPDFTPEKTFAGPDIKVSPETAGMLQFLVPFAGIILILMLGDLLFRRHIFLKKHHGR